MKHVTIGLDLAIRGDGYIRRLLMHGARTVTGWRRRRYVNSSAWISGLLTGRPMNVATTTLANNNARISWALMARGGMFRASRQVAPG